MTRVAVLGWGSRGGDPRELPNQGKGFKDGPLVQVEFARQSKDNRITLVLEKDAPPVRSLWAMMDCTELETAKEALREREDCKAEAIHAWPNGRAHCGMIFALDEWAQARSIEAVIWTGLPSKFKGTVGHTPKDRKSNRLNSSH